MRFVSAAIPCALFASCVSAQFVEPGTQVLYMLDGTNANDQFGWISEAVGDLTGDGVSELLIGAPFNDDGAINGGSAYLYNGASGAPIRQHMGLVAVNQMGFSVNPAGDVNNDGTLDYIVGAPAGVTGGRAYVFSGVDGSEIHVFTGESSFDQFGYSVTSVGDLNNDNHDDLLVGAIAHDFAFTNAGRAYVLSGIDFSTIRTHDGEGSTDNFGTAVAAMGDVDDDGVPDYAVAAHNAGAGNDGKVYVFSGDTGNLIWDADAIPAGATFGQFFTASPGDVNGDGYNDLYVPDFSDATLGGGTGRSYLYCGQSGNLIHSLVGSSAGQGFGIGRGAGDVNNDGLPDLVLASWTSSDGASAAGKAQLFGGRDGRLLRTVTSTTSNEAFGFDAHGLGDTNGDGNPDFIVTAPYNGTNGFRSGRVYLIAGVAHSTCTADWNDDALVNTSDFIGYLNDYNAVLNGTPFINAAPDMADPCGVLNTADFIAFLNAYNAGCPLSPSEEFFPDGLSVSASRFLEVGAEVGEHDGSD